MFKNPLDFWGAMLPPVSGFELAPSRRPTEEKDVNSLYRWRCHGNHVVNANYSNWFSGIAITVSSLSPARQLAFTLKTE